MQLRHASLKCSGLSVFAGPLSLPRRINPIAYTLYGEPQLYSIGWPLPSQAGALALLVAGMGCA